MNEPGLELAPDTPEFRIAEATHQVSHCEYGTALGYQRQGQLHVRKSADSI